MLGHLWKLALVVALSHGYRVVGRTIGPRWAGLITALPCSTAIALLGGGSDLGLDYAVAMASACWVGLAGASALSLAFASAIVAEWGLVRSIALGVVSYFAVMAGILLLGQFLGGNCPASLLFLALATWLATRVGDPVATPNCPNVKLTNREVFWLRTAVPAACVGTAISLGEQLGPSVAGCLGAFPGVTLTSLVLTRLEAGPVPAVRMARALPPGNWAMAAFLLTFIQTAPTIGLIPSIAFGYAAALTCLGTVAHLTRPPTRAQIRIQILARRDHLRLDPSGTVPPPPNWPRTPRHFAPLVESVAA